MRTTIIICSLIISLFLIFFVRGWSQQITYPTMDDATSIDSIVMPFLEDDRTKALSIGIIENGKITYYNYGNLTAEDETTPTEETIYEIGSITKTFTASLLIQMVDEGLVMLDDPISKYLPEGVCKWSSDKAITLQDLTSHNSGLPRLASNFFATVTDMKNPYKDYNVDHMYAFLKSFKGVAKEERNVQYSNVGVELLGHILCLVSKKSYEELLNERIFGPLDMKNTTITFDENHLKKLAKGHNEKGQPTSNWDLPIFGGAGAIRSTTEDMLKYLQAQMTNDLYSKIHEPRVDMDERNKVGCGWITSYTKAGEPIVWHNGGTGGYMSIAGFIKERNLGVVVLNNASISVDQIGFLLLGLLISE